MAPEGYDTILVLAEALRRAGADRERLAGALQHLSVEGTRGTIRLARTPGVPVAQWVWPPVRVTARSGRE